MLFRFLYAIMLTGLKEMNIMQVMGKNYKGKHLKKNKLKKAQLAGKKVIRNKIAKSE